jgi:hypothetical protein
VSTPAQFTAKMRRATDEIANAGKSGVEQVSLELTKRARRNIAGASGGDSRLSGVGARGAKVGARYKVRGTTENPSALVSAEGPLHLIERDTKAHTETPRRLNPSSRRRSGPNALSTPYGPRRSVTHPGTKGQHPFERAVDATAPDALRIFQRELGQALRRAFR